MTEHRLKTSTFLFNVYKRFLFIFVTFFTFFNFLFFFLERFYIYACHCEKSEGTPFPQVLWHNPKSDNSRSCTRCPAIIRLVNTIDGRVNHARDLRFLDRPRDEAVEGGRHTMRPSRWHPSIPCLFVFTKTSANELVWPIFVIFLSRIQKWTA